MNLLENYLSQVSITSTWVTILLDATIKGAVILLIASVLCFFLRRTSAAARHLVWSLALISVLALPVFSMLLPGWSLPVLPKITIIERPTDTAKTIDDFFSPVLGNAALQEFESLPNITAMEQQAAETKTFDNLLTIYSKGAALKENQLKSPETVLSSTGTSELNESSTVLPSDESRTHNAGLNLSAWLVIIWLVGTLLIFARMLTGVIGVHVVKRRAQPVIDASIVNLSHRIAKNLGLKRRFKLLKSSRTRVPMTLGFFKPVVLLPEDAETWPSARQKVVLLHELAHIKRSDIVYNVISQVVAALYWFNPLVWYAHHVLYAERERACDDYVIVSGIKSTDYANHLLDIARSLRSERWISFAPVTMARRSQLEWRMRAILDPEKCRRALKPVTTIAACLIVASLVLPFAAMQPVEKEVKITGESTSRTEKIDIPLSSVTDIEENLPEDIDAQQQQRNQLIANVIRSLIDSLKSENTDVKMEAVFMLGNFIGTSSAYLKDSSLLDALIPLMKDKDADVRLGALLLIEKFEESAAALEVILDAIHDKNAKIREEACDLLGYRIRKMSQTEAAETTTMDPRILNALKDAMNDEEPKVRMTALEYFRYLPESDTLGPLIGALKDKDERVRMSAAEYLSSFENPEARDALISAMNDSSAYVQLTIVRALNVIKRGTTRISSRTGINIISDSELDEVDLKMLDVIINALQNENYRNRSLAIRIISDTFVTQKSFDALITAAKDENPRVRRDAVTALGIINDTRVIQILIAALKDEDRNVRMAAARELGRILDIRENLPEETIQQQEDILKAVQKEKTEYIQKSAVEQAGNIEGYVKDKETKQPLVGVNVSLISMKNYSSLGTIPMVGVHISLSSGKRDSSWSMITKTDKNGYFLMSDLSVDHYSVNVSRIGYKTFSPKSGGVRILGASGFDIHFLQVQPNKTTQINFEMIPQDSVGNIEGYVTDKNTGKPLAGVNIFLNDTTYARKDSIPLSGITTFTYDEIINMSASNLRRLLETHSGINVLTNTPYIRKNQPIAVTDEKGYYIIRNVPPGIYSLIAKKEGYFSNVRDSVQVETGKTTRLDFNLTAGVEDIVIQVSKPSGKIDGYVKDKNTGQPIAGVNIFLSDTTSTQKDSIPLSRIKTLSYEEITKMPASDISKLLAAQSSITVLKDTSTEKRLDRTSRVNTLSYEEITKMSVSDISKLLAAQSSITVLTNTPAKKGGYEARDVQDIRMRGGRNEEVALVIDGQVVRNPVFGGFSTSAEQSDVTSRPIAVTDEYGYFVVPNVPPGIYSVIASKTGYKSQTQENVRVTSGVITQIPFELTVIKEPAESVQDTEQKQEYTATVLLSDSTIKKLDNVDFIIPDGAGMTTEGITIIGKNIEIIPPEGDPKIQKMSILEYARTFYLPRDVNKNNKIVYQ